MGIKLIRNRPHYYRSVREGDRVRSVYLGIGEQALALAARDEEIKRKSKVEREVDEAQEREVAEWFASVEAFTRATIEAAGYHQHKRQWRRRTMSSAESTALTTTTKPGKRELSPKALAILERFRAGDKTISHQDARRLLKERPEMLDTNGSPAFSLIVTWIDKCYKDDDMFRRQAMYENVARVKADLAGPNPTPTELLLAERAAVCWLEVNTLEMSVATMKETFPVIASYWTKRMDSAHRRFLSAVRTLAIVRKLAVPDVRINIDGRSVHIGGKQEQSVEGSATVEINQP